QKRGRIGAGADWHPRSHERPRRGGPLGGARRAHGGAGVDSHGTHAALARAEERLSMAVAPRQQLADELLRRFAAALRASQLYSSGHPIIARNLEALSAAMQLLHALEPSIVLGIVGDEIVVDDVPIAKA